MITAADSTPNQEDVLVMLRQDWQTVNDLLDDLSARQAEPMPAADRSGLLVRVSTRLNAISEIEVELLYPHLGNTSELEAGRRLHAELRQRIHAALEHSADESYPATAVEELAQVARRLEAHDASQVYSRCSPEDLKPLLPQLMERRARLLKGLTED